MNWIQVICMSLILWAGFGSAAVAQTAPDSCEAKCKHCGDEAPTCVVGCILTGKADCATSGEQIVEECESACTKACSPWDIPKCVANCVTTGQPDCETIPAPASCMSECQKHCPEWKDPEKFANCAVSCADTGQWACYDDGGAPPLPQSCQDSIDDWERITWEIAEGVKPREKDVAAANAATAACFSALLGAAQSRPCRE